MPKAQRKVRDANFATTGTWTTGSSSGHEGDSLYSTDSNGTATWNLGVPTDANVSISITSSTGQTVFSGSYNVAAGQNHTFAWDGKGNDGTQWPDGQYKLTATAADTAGNTVAVNTQIQGVVNSVDLTQSPPLLSINGQNYLVNQIKSIAQ